MFKSFKKQNQEMKEMLRGYEKRVDGWTDNITPVKVILSWIAMILLIVGVYSFFSYETPRVTNAYCFESRDALLYRDNILRGDNSQQIFLMNLCIKIEEELEIEFVLNHGVNRNLFKVQLEDGNTMWAIKEDIKGFENIDDVIRYDNSFRLLDKQQ